MRFDHQGPVSNVGPLGSQHSHHTTLRGNKVCLCVKKSVSYVAAHMRLHLFPCSQHVCVCSCVICGSAEVATVQYGSGGPTV